MFVIDIFKVILNIIYLPFKCLKRKNKILFLSRQTNTPSLEYRMIIEELAKKNEKIKIVMITKKIEKNLVSLIVNFFLLFLQMYHIATSKVVITDGYSIPVSILKHRSDITIIQMWHANGIIKKIGLQTLEKKSEKQRNLALKMNMHQNYTYVISSSFETSKVFKEAFNVKMNQILCLGTPMLDYLYQRKNEKNEELKEKYNLQKKKKVIVYFPTYRKHSIPFDNILPYVDFEQYYFVIKAHPVGKEKITDERVIMVKDEIAEDLISIADYVITDYSNVAFEAILSNKKTYFYLYDLIEYEKDFGLNINLKKEIPEYTFCNFKKLMKKIKSGKYDTNKIKKFAYQYIETYDGKCTKRIVQFLIDLMEEK